MEKVIITCSLTEGVVLGEPAATSTQAPDAITREADAAVKAGAAVLRLTSMNDRGLPTSDPTFLRRTLRHIEERRDCLVEVSTVVTPRATLEERLKVLSVRADIVAIPCGSANLGTEVLVQPTEWVKALVQAATEHGAVINLVCHDLSHVYAGRRVLDEGTIQGSFFFSLLLGGGGGVQSDIRSLLHLVDALPRGALWSAGSLDRGGRLVAGGAVLMGGHPRVGFEDSAEPRPGSLTAVERVGVVKAVASAIGRQVATPEEARALLKGDKSGANQPR